ncbi:MAG: hypothetical protein RB289_11425 [Paludibacter sp.]|jgi:hypothetical protein|nr:hypothetical protein [Paludibacter sp.]
MARSKNILQVEGTIGLLSFYRLHGHDEMIVRTKGGPKKEDIKEKPQFEAVRRNNEEWRACTNMTSHIRLSFYHLIRLEDYPVTGALNAICKQIQEADTKEEHGSHEVKLSEHREMLAGFSLSRKQVFESAVRVPVTAEIDRVTGKAQIDIGEVNTELYLYNFRQLPVFRIVAMLSPLVNIVYGEKSYIEYNQSNERFFNRKTGCYESEWLQTMGTHPAMHIELEYPMNINPIPPNITLMLTIGIEFGKPGPGNSYDPVKYAGTGKIVKLG